MPLFFAVFGAIILAGFPDYESDKIMGKATLTVILGQRKASLISFLSISLSIISSIIIIYSGVLGIASLLFLITTIHGLLLSYLLLNQLTENVIEKRVDKLLQVSMSYILWFTIVPLLYLLKII